jgi:hypothetical protein
MIKGDNILNVGTPAGGGVSIIANDPVTSGGGGGDNPPITTALEIYHNPDVESYSDDGTTLAVNGDYVRKGNFVIESGKYIEQSNATKQMQYKTTVLPNGKASYYKASNDNMFLSENYVFTASESFIAYSVHKRANTGSNAIFGKHSSGNNTIMDWGAGTVFFGDNGGLTSVGTTITLNTVVRAYVIDRTAQLLRVYENGSQIASVDITARNQSTTFDLMFNRHTYGTGSIDFGITLLYRDLHDATQVGQISDWMNTYYGDLIY